jgi:hypothetical protein
VTRPRRWACQNDLAGAETTPWGTIPGAPVRGGGLRSGIAPSRCLGTPLPSRGVLQRILRGSNGFAAILMRHLPRWPLAILTRYGTNEA